VTGKKNVTGRKRVGRRFQILLAVGGAVGVFLGVQIKKQQRAGQAKAQLQQTLYGTWELTSLHGAAVGPEANSTVISQRVTFHDQRIEGETRLRAGTEATTTAMPFPDTSAQRVELSPDGFEVIVHWSGSYRMTKNSDLELMVGKAKYYTEPKWNPQTQTLELDPDAILTYPGPAVYRAAPVTEARKTAAVP
jgi:hypothetical protein